MWLGHHFQDQKVKGQLAGGGGILWRPPTQLVSLCVCLVPRPYTIYFILLWNDITCLCRKKHQSMNQPIFFSRAESADSAKRLQWRRTVFRRESMRNANTRLCRRRQQSQGDQEHQPTAVAVLSIRQGTAWLLRYFRRKTAFWTTSLILRVCRIKRR